MKHIYTEGSGYSPTTHPESTVLSGDEGSNEILQPRCSSGLQNDHLCGPHRENPRVVIYTTPEKVVLCILIILLFCVSVVVIFSNDSTTPLLFSQDRNFFLIDINSASLEELSLIPYISRNIAQKIITYRQEKGPIHDVNELLILKDIGPATLKRLKDYLKDTSH